MALSSRLVSFLSTSDANNPFLYEDTKPKTPSPTAQPPPTFRRRCCIVTKKQMAIGSVLITLIAFGIAALVMKLSAKGIAKSAISSTDIEILRLELSDPSEMSVTFKEVQLNVRTQSNFHATMKPANLSIIIKNESVGYFMTESMELYYGENLQTLRNAVFTVQDMEAWTMFSSQLVHDNNVTWTLKGYVDMNVHLLWGVGAPKVLLEKQVVFRGMSGLKKVTIAMYNFTTLNADTCIYNPSIIAMSPIGASCMLVHYPPNSTENNTIARFVTSVNTGLPITKRDRSHPTCSNYGPEYAFGYNLLHYNGTAIASNSSSTIDMLSKYASGGSVDVTVTSCTPNATSIALYNAAMQNLSMLTSIPSNRTN